MATKVEITIKKTVQFNRDLSDEQIQGLIDYMTLSVQVSQSEDIDTQVSWSREKTNECAYYHDRSVCASQNCERCPEEGYGRRGCRTAP